MKSQGHLLSLILLAVWALLDCCPGVAAGSKEGPSLGRQVEELVAQELKCRKFVSNYLEQRGGGALSQEQDPSKMVFFLHVPRTAGRSYYNCFLHPAHPPSQRCAKSYDLLRLNISLPGCKLLSTHDDMSISGQLPAGGAVITQLRKPLDRVLSSYEFSVNIAAQYLAYADDRDPNNNTVSTLRVWPWSQLVPWFRADMRRRLAALNEAARKDKSGQPRWVTYKDPKGRPYYWSSESNTTSWELPEGKPVLDPYNNPLVTPLHEWIELPVARELVHETTTLQILGLTNYSAWPEHSIGRACAFEDPTAREALLGMAMRRLLGMKHVGVTERLDESVASLAASLGIRMDSPAYDWVSQQAFSYDGDEPLEDVSITYNSSLHDGNVTVSLSEARRRLLDHSTRRIELRDEIKVMKPKLTSLVQRERMWLEQQAEAAATGAAGVDDERPPPPRRKLKSTDEKKQAQTDGVPRPNDKAADKEKEAQGAVQDIDSPWAKAIVDMDTKVWEMQEEVKRLDWDMWQIQTSGGVRQAEKALGRARQLLPDSHFERQKTVGEYYTECTTDTKTKHSSFRRNKPFKYLVTPQLESFYFTRKARAKIPQAVLDRIVELNTMDQQLWELGERLLTAKVAEQRAAGLLESFPQPVPEPRERQQHETEEVSAGGEGSGVSSKEEQRLEEEYSEASDSGSSLNLDEDLVSGMYGPNSAAQQHGRNDEDSYGLEDFNTDGATDARDEL